MGPAETVMGPAETVMGPAETVMGAVKMPGARELWAPNVHKSLPLGNTESV
jgi:hypothetical protein